MFDPDTPTDDGECVCEPDRAIQRLGNMRTLYANVVSRFVADSAGNFARLSAAVAANDRQVINQTAHSLRGLAAMCGATGVVTILGELEAAGTTEDNDEIVELHERLKRAMTRTQQALSPYLQPTERGP